MSRCEDCIHYNLCLNLNSRQLAMILAGDKADERCKSFKSTADVVEVRHGEWITHTHFYECSNCEFIYETDVIAFDYNPITDFDLHYCSVCGAKMDGERREE